MNCLSTRVCYKRPAVFRARTLPVRQPAHFPGSSRRFSRHPGPRARPSCHRYTPSCRNTSDCRCRRIWRRSVQCCRSTAWTRARRWITVTWTATRWAAIFTAGILWTWGCRAYRRTWARRTTRTRTRRRPTTRSGSRARKCWEWRRRRRYVRRTINCESSFTDFCKYEKLVPGNLTHIWYQRKCFARVINLREKDSLGYCQAWRDLLGIVYTYDSISTDIYKMFRKETYLLQIFKLIAKKSNFWYTWYQRIY